MPRLRNRLVYDLINVAKDLTLRPGQSRHRQASMRRAVSTAYYAVFHALCFVCADSLVGFSRTELLEPIYRTVDHANARKLLLSEAARSISPSLAQVGDRFATLQRQRHLVDYMPPRILLKGKNEALALIDLATNAIELIERLDVEARLALAVLLISRPKS